MLVVSAEIEPKERRIRIRVLGFNVTNSDLVLCRLLQYVPDVDIKIAREVQRVPTKQTAHEAVLGSCTYFAWGWKSL